MNSNPEISFSTRIRKSPFFDSTMKWGCKGFTVYNRMYMPTYYKTFVEDEGGKGMDFSAMLPRFENRIRNESGI